MFTNGLELGGYNAVLMYHSVGGGLFDHIPPERFRADLKHLSEQYEIVDLPAVASPSSRSKKQVALTFDDGYRDFYDEVVPLLHEFEAPATVFVISTTLFDEGFVHDDVFEYDYMSRSQVEKLVDDDLVTIGNHTRTHPDLSAVSDVDVLESEILGAKRDLERELSVDVTRFCYPYNCLNTESVDVVCRSHEYAVCGPDPGTLRLNRAHRCRLPRLNGAVDRNRLERALTDRTMVRQYVKDRVAGGSASELVRRLMN